MQNQCFPEIIQYTKQCLKPLKLFHISHVSYAFSACIRNIADFGLSKRIGGEFSTLSHASSPLMTAEQIRLADSLPVQHCWSHETDFLWSDRQKWKDNATKSQILLHQKWQEYGCGVGVSFVLIRKISALQTSASAVLFHATSYTQPEFDAIYNIHAAQFQKTARIFDTNFRKKFLLKYYGLNSHELDILQLYARLGDISLIAKDQNLNSRTIQLHLQRARKKLAAPNNTIALNLCNTYQLLEKISQTIPGTL